MLGTTNKASLMKGYNFYNFQEESTKVLRHLRGAEKLMEVLDVKDYLAEMGLHSNSARLFLNLLAMISQILSLLAVKIVNHQSRNEGW